MPRRPLTVLHCEYGSDADRQRTELAWFHRSSSMLTEIFQKQAMVGIVGSIGSAIGGLLRLVAHPRQADGHSGRGGEIPFCNRRIYGNRGKYDQWDCSPWEFVFTKEANQPDWRRKSLPADARLCHRWLGGGGTEVRRKCGVRGYQILSRTTTW